MNPSSAQAKKLAQKKSLPEATEELASLADSTEVEVPLPQLVKDLLELHQLVSSKISALESLLEPSDQTPPYAALQAMLGDDDVALVYDVKLITRDATEFDVRGFSTFTDAVESSMLPETVVNFHQVIMANLMRPVLTKFNAFVQPLIRSLAPMGSSATELTSGFDDPHVHFNNDPLQGKGPESRSPGDLDILP